MSSNAGISVRLALQHLERLSLYVLLVTTPDLRDDRLLDAYRLAKCAAPGMDKKIAAPEDEQLLVDHGVWQSYSEEDRSEKLKRGRGPVPKLLHHIGQFIGVGQDAQKLGDAPC